MPGFNGTGPMGYGPGSGWGLGPCGAGMGWRRGGGQGHGRGLGFRRWGGYSYPYQPQVTPKEETEMLTNDAEALEEELKAIKTRLAELEGQK